VAIATQQTGRARSLFVAIDKLLRGQKLPNAARAFFIYDTLYEATSGDAIERPVPEGRLLSQSANAEALLADARASDGVVPARSQTLDGKAAGIVVGDHLDVVGSFDGGNGVNVMRSGANFSGRDFESALGRRRELPRALIAPSTRARTFRSCCTPRPWNDQFGHARLQSPRTPRIVRAAVSGGGIPPSPGPF
jgi:hypothetical protein